MSARKIQRVSGVWDGVEVHVGGKPTAYLGGYGLSMGRKRLLDILAERATDLGVDIQFQREVEDLSEFADADLVVASDGVNSRERQLFAKHYQTDVLVGRNKYLWLGTYRVFGAFRYAFEETPAGWIWLHAYYLDAERSTCIVECSPETWEGLGFHELGADQSMRLLEQIFERHLRGRSLINQLRSVDDTLPWHNFRIIRNNTWYRDNVALIGDAAHTTHFSIGSGTKLAIGDAIALAANLDSHADLHSALRTYDEQRRAEVAPIQRNAVSSMRWLENVAELIGQDNVHFAYALSKRYRQQPLWRYHLHVATQIPALRAVRRKLTSARRWRHARLRERLADVQQRPFHRSQRTPIKT
ncbi:MAG: FAD-dependent monooxygenase [Actinomycetota bacterium]|nr:FAD-dependent monooxygenase [Actinomycetota bacterium]